MAYAAVISLVHTIKCLLNSSRISVASSTRQTLRSAYHDARLLRRTLNCCSQGLTSLDEQIIVEEARKLEDAIEFPLLTHFLEQSERGETTLFLNLHQLKQDVDCFSEAAKKIKHNIEQVWEQKSAKMIEEYIVEIFVPKTLPKDVEEEEDMVGLSDQFVKIRDSLVSSDERAKYNVYVRDIIVWISGMAGVGKTAIAKKIFHDPLVKGSFESRAFVRVGHEFWPREILQAISAQLSLPDQEMIMEEDEDFRKCLCRILTVKKSLIILDYVWESFFFSDLLLAYIQHDKGSRILITSRLNEYYPFLGVFEMRFMNKEESWELLRRTVFGEEEECPPQLVKAGKKIAKKCGGLPLLINAVAPILLSKAQNNLECWNRVAEKPDSVLEEASHQISEVLLSSYHQISEDEKLCFLYFVVFPQNYIIRNSTIGNLWYAEGFIDYCEISFFTILYTLIRSNLVMGRQRSLQNGFTKSCSLHLAYWYVSKRVAENNTFLHILNSYTDGLDARVKNNRRLAIHNKVLFAIKEVHDNIASISTVRSLLCTGTYHEYQVPICWEWKLLRVLHALTIRFYEFPIEVVKLIRLRYLSLTCNANLPPSISKLRILEVLIVHQHVSIKRVADESYLPLEIWDLKELVHLEIVGRNIPDPRPGMVLPNLVNLLDVGVESCTKGVLPNIPKLKKLRIQIELAFNVTWTLWFFDCLSCLHKLESLQCCIMNSALFHPPPPISISLFTLKSLSLSGFGYPWEDMSKIAALPNLQKLKLQCYAFRGEKWEVKELRFSSLLCLLIEDTDLVQWTAEFLTFPQLSSLTMRNCYKLREIPIFEFGIELVDCNPTAEACAKQMVYYPERVDASYSWKGKKPKQR